MRPAANKKIVNFDFTGVPPHGGIESVPFNIAILVVKQANLLLRPR
jgi:hypothetical protein